MGGDAADDMIDDMEADGDEGDMDKGDDEEIEDRVVDLEDAPDDPKAEFEKMMPIKMAMKVATMTMPLTWTWVMKRRKTRQLSLLPNLLAKNYH